LNQATNPKIQTGVDLRGREEFPTTMNNLDDIGRPKDLKPTKTWSARYMGFFGATASDRYVCIFEFVPPNEQRELPVHQRRQLQFLFFWCKYHFVVTLYHQHSMPYSLIREPSRLRFWLRALSPITPLFGGIHILESNSRYTLFCNMIAWGRGIVIPTAK
jgi:hypothetical protein